MNRPKLGPRDRVRVELRLPRAVAEAIYRCAREWNMSLSEAGSRLIESGYQNPSLGAKIPGVKGDSRLPESAPTNASAETGGAARDV